jgi:hypothetical protein
MRSVGDVGPGAVAVTRLRLTPIRSHEPTQSAQPTGEAFRLSALLAEIED